MLKQIVVDKVMARQMWKLGFQEPALSYYDVDGYLQNAEDDTLQLKDYMPLRKRAVAVPDAMPPPLYQPSKTGYAGRSTMNCWFSATPSSRIQATIIADLSGFPMG